MNSSDSNVSERKPYHSPNLIVFGDIRELTKGKDGSKTDTGNKNFPHTTN